MLYNSWYMASEVKTGFKPPAYRMPKECIGIETASPQLCRMYRFSSSNNYLLLLAKLTFWVGIRKQLFCQLLVSYLIYLARENRYWVKLMLCPVSALASKPKYWPKLTLCPLSSLPCKINQISDSS